MRLKILFLLIVCMFGCYYQNNDHQNNENEEYYTTAESIFVSNNDVYVAGHEWIWDGQHGPNRAKYWKNGKPIYLADQSYNSLAYDIFCTSNDVYVAYVEDNYLKCVKNDVDQNIYIHYASNQKVNFVVYNNDIYFTGIDYNQNVGKIWINNTDTKLKCDDSCSVAPYSISISNGNIYVLGQIWGKSSTGILAYWKNNVPVELTDGTTRIDDPSMVVDGDNIYICGSLYNKSDKKYEVVLIKNGILTTISQGNNDNYASSIFIYNNDVYISGYEIYDYDKSRAKYWKNDQEYILSDGSIAASATSIFIINDNVYVCGQDGIERKAKYWINGTATSLP